MGMGSCAHAADMAMNITTDNEMKIRSWVCFLAQTSAFAGSDGTDRTNRSDDNTTRHLSAVTNETSQKMARRRGDVTGNAWSVSSRKPSTTSGDSVSDDLARRSTGAESLCGPKYRLRKETPSAQAAGQPHNRRQ